MVLFLKKKCAHLTLTVSPLACWVLNCVQFIISQVFFLALMRSVHANNLSHLGLTDTVHINAGLYGCWWNLGFLHVWLFSAPSNSTVCYKILLRSFSLFPALFCMLAVWWKLYRIHKILKLYFIYGHVYAYFCIKSELANIVLLEAQDCFRKLYAMVIGVTVCLGFSLFGIFLQDLSRFLVILFQLFWKPCSRSKSWLVFWWVYFFFLGILFHIGYPQ